MPTIKGPIRLGRLKDREDYTDEFAERLHKEQIEFSLPFVGMGWQSDKHSDMVKEPNIDELGIKTRIEEGIAMEVSVVKQTTEKDIKEFETEKRKETESKIAEIKKGFEKTLEEKLELPQPIIKIVPKEELIMPTPKITTVKKVKKLLKKWRNK